jgi:hypothetical protein
MELAGDIKGRERELRSIPAQSWVGVGRTWPWSQIHHFSDWSGKFQAILITKGQEIRVETKGFMVCDEHHRSDI